MMHYVVKRDAHLFEMTAKARKSCGVNNVMGF